MAELGVRLFPSPQSNRDSEQKGSKIGVFPPFVDSSVSRVASTAAGCVPASPSRLHLYETSHETTGFSAQQMEVVKERISTKSDEGGQGKETEEGKEGDKEMVLVEDEGNKHDGQTKFFSKSSMENNVNISFVGESKENKSQDNMQVLPVSAEGSWFSHGNQVTVEKICNGQSDLFVRGSESATVVQPTKSPMSQISIVDKKAPGNSPDSVNLPLKRSGEYTNNESGEDGHSKDRNVDDTTAKVMEKKMEDGHDPERDVATESGSQLNDREDDVMDYNSMASQSHQEPTPGVVHGSIAHGATLPSTEAIRVGSIQPTGGEDSAEENASVEGPFSNDANMSGSPRCTEESETCQTVKGIAPNNPLSETEKGAGEIEISGTSLINRGIEAVVEERETIIIKETEREVIEEVYTVIEKTNATGYQHWEIEEVHTVCTKEMHTTRENVEIQTGSSLGDFHDEVTSTGISVEHGLNPSIESQDIELFSVEELVRGESLADNNERRDLSIETQVSESQIDSAKERGNMAEEYANQTQVIQTDYIPSIAEEPSKNQVQITSTKITQVQTEGSRENLVRARKSPDHIVTSMEIPEAKADSCTIESQKTTESTPIMQPESTSKAEDSHMQDNQIGQDVSEQELQEIKGCKVWKRFGRKKYLGDIVDYDPENKWFKVVYEDGDAEDLDLNEIKEILLPRGTLPKSVSKKRVHTDDESDEGRTSKQQMRSQTPKKPKATEGTKSRAKRTPDKAKRPYRRKKQAQVEPSMSKDVSSTTESTMTGNEASETDSAIPQETPMKSQGRKKRTQSDAEVSTSSKLPPRIAPAEGEETKGKRERKRKIQFDAEVSTGNTKALDTTDDITQVTQTSKDEITSDQNNNKKQKIDENIEELKCDRSESDAVETAALIGKQVGKDFNGTFCI